MTDLENRFWLCGEVVDAVREDGLNVKRALAMLHRLTDPGRAEPYLTDLESGWPDVTVATLEVRYDDGLGPLPPVEEVLATPGPLCAICEMPLERRHKESYAAFYARETCSKSHAAMLRAQRKRESELVSA